MSTISPASPTASATSSSPRTLPSYLQGEWRQPTEGSATGIAALDASTGEPVALVSSDGLDLAAAVDHARTVGQGALGRLTFHQRALILKALAQHLNSDEVKADLYEVSARTGATRRDSLVDVDGGIGVLFSYASKGRRELPNAFALVDGAPENLARDGSFGGQHLYVRIPGVSFQVNAFNFPVWGMLEKFAPAFLAGVPSIVKPATPTAFLTEAAVRAIVDSGLLPEGSLQLVCGSVHGFLDLLDVRDVVGFTGSASTASAFSGHANVLSGGVGLTCETDSLNAAILGPDAVAGTPEFDAFIASVVTEMTAKAGQKCTSIRRVIVPADALDAVVAAIGTRLDARVTSGDPRADGVTMGPLASREQKAEVRRSVEALLAGGGRIAYGSLEEPRVTRADGTVGPAPSGAFFSPVLLRFDDADADAVHEVEAFGPVASVLGYRDLADAVRLANRGGGSLVATVASADPSVVATLVSGIAPFHGRVLVLDRDDARSSTGHGSPVPHLVHGGPGRAGGGEELGGIRAVKHYMRRTALQGSPAVLTALTGQWRAGAGVQAAPSSAAAYPSTAPTAPSASVGEVDPADPVGEHPFRKPLSRLRLGDAIASEAREITLDDIGHFAEFTGDTFYAHTDEEAAAANPFFPGRVAHGYLLISWAAGLFVDPAPGPVLANYGLENLRFLTPVSPGDSIRVTLTAKEITPRENEDYGEVRWDAVLHNQRDDVVATYDVLTLVAKE
ncbi:phenylacetic acid degradation bifunctional protein PaaZ [Herbiconiux ginsengi]|uniref:Oxepin-CoA hydrolase / 3-oxo-5,6-dehydrosuberyl-CoA semialdehyde dehydrogenase n=1 Tax=Herbiconiux ginsengi TaxID=381665 RepID=A0A1H3MZS3_9MICO|nr:phenylacetic acid degradation bifunctional protein PaaZ [Herbiconiux ginsengi]SDY82116.1 oxepin-CoA hydrolase / 3-oxo-5,6-dehydrosuberyl-CoA semialdehyde dehydrogenase [Herbiconiux ginsengi]